MSSVRLKEVDKNYWDIEEGKEGFIKFLATVGFKRTFKNCSVVIRDTNAIKRYGVFYSDGLVHLDFDCERDLVIVGKIEVYDWIDDNALKIMVETFLDKEFSKL